ncbi:MAG: signal recognition particle receptor subunit alpha [Rickettsiales bacterium]
MFDKLRNGISAVMDKFFTSQITEKDLDLAMREFKILLLESDVALSTVKELIAKIKEKAIGQEIFKNFSPKKMITKIVHDELINMLNAENIELNLLNNKTNIIMLCGLQGSGKTSSCAKLAKFIIKKFENSNKKPLNSSVFNDISENDNISKNVEITNIKSNINTTDIKTFNTKQKEKITKKILLVSLDIYRPAAQLQLQILADQIGVDFLNIIENEKPLETCKRALHMQKEYDLILFDTAGRVTIDANMMEELKQIEKLIKPTECFFVADALMGQSSIKTAETFASHVNLTGVIITRIDSDAKGGAAISIKHSLNKPIKFLCKGEKVDDIEVFHPDRIVSRIMDMGDITSLIEQMQNSISEQEASKLSTRIMEGKFSLEDYLMFIKSINKFGGIGSILSFLPGMSTIKDTAINIQKNESSFKKHLVIITSMTPKERKNPKILNASRKIRISKGSGTKVEDINSLLKQYFDMEKIIKQFFNGNSKISNLLKNFI